MKTKNIFKALALAMLMPAMLLTTACSSEDDLVNNTANTENTINKGYALPVTVNVTRGDATTRATFDGSKLAFSTGDQLFVYGDAAGGAGYFAGMLDYVSEGTFSGTIYTQNEYSGTADALFTAANSDRVVATLFPNGYESYKFLSLSGSGYSTSYIVSLNKAIAATKAAAVEQFSFETAETYSSGFALSPQNAILNFTITGLTDGAKDVTLKNGSTTMFVGSVTPTSGTATFALGARIKDLFSSSPVNLKNVILTIGDTDIDITDADKYLTAGKIYNITRGTGATVDLSTKEANYTAQNGETLTGTLASNVKISIANGATVILDNVTINGTSDLNYVWGGINCGRDAKIILKGTNTLKGFYQDYPGIYVPDGCTLTIEGTGSLNASSNGFGAGIGGANGLNCGNIIINGGTITATGGDYAAGIGGGGEAVCWGNITINGGTITATGGDDGAGIGSGGNNEEWYYDHLGDICGVITINGGTITANGGSGAAGIGSGSYGYCEEVIIKNTVTRVTATKGVNAPHAIGIGSYGSCASVTIGDTDGYIEESPYIYEP